MTFNPQRGTRTSSNENLNQEIKNPFELAKIPEIESSKYKNSKSNEDVCEVDSSLQRDGTIQAIKLTNFEVKLCNRLLAKSSIQSGSITIPNCTEESKNRISQNTSNAFNTLNENNQNVPLLKSQASSIGNNINKDQSNSNQSASRTDIIYHHNQKRYKQNEIDLNKDEFELNYVDMNIERQKEIKMKNAPLNGSQLSNKASNILSKRNRFTSYYRKKVETAIFLFNTNQYEKAYSSLIENEIISKKKEDFAKALLLIDGFDKILIGDFLSAEKTPNEHFSVTKPFIKLLDFSGLDLIDSFQFLLSVLVLPLMNETKYKNILKIFSVVYYNDLRGEMSLNNTLYKSSDEIMSLCLVALEIDKLVKRKAKGMTKEEFIHGHPNIDPLKLDEIYDKILSKNGLNTIPHDEYRDLVIKKIIINQEKAEGMQKNLISTNDNFIKSLKKREGFDLSIKNQLHQILFYLAENEQYFIIKRIRCSCGLGINSKIIIGDITNVLLGNSSENKTEYEYYMTIETKNRLYELKHSNKELLIRYVAAIKKLINQKKSILDLNAKQKIQKENISFLWQDIIKNWADYRDYLLVKNKRKNYFNNKNKNEALGTLITAPLKIKKEEVLYLWTLGLPSWLRQKMWKIVVGDTLDISENLCNGFISSDDEDEILHSALNDKINKHINKVKETFPFANSNINFDDNMKKIIKAFCLYRPDIVYCKPLAYIAAICMLNSENYYDAFVLMCNLVIPNCLFKFILEDEDLGQRYLIFFRKIFKNRLPKLHEHFVKFGAEEKLFFYKWAKYLFVLTFPYETILHMWDCFIIKGDIFIFEVCLGILHVLEKHLINSSFNEIFSKLSVFPTEYIESLWDTIEKIDITKEFKEEIEEYEIGREKGELLKDA